MIFGDDEFLQAVENSIRTVGQEQRNWRENWTEAYMSSAKSMLKKIAKTKEPDYDCIQEFYIKFLKKAAINLNTLRGLEPNKRLGWLYSSLRNSYRDFLRSNRRPKEDSYEEIMQILAYEPDPFEPDRDVDFCDVLKQLLCLNEDPKKLLIFLYGEVYRVLYSDSISVPVTIIKTQVCGKTLFYIFACLKDDLSKVHHGKIESEVYRRFEGILNSDKDGQKVGDVVFNVKERTISDWISRMRRKAQAQLKLDSD
ncbi:MAG: hypothetical protein LBU32_24400 [Clostridiales bacterium]|nr:hypothetical protein [Clostridiales bacterium]